MKNIFLYILALIFVFTACTNEIPFDIDDNPPKLIVNALLDSSKERNNIVLALTGRERVTIVTDATIDVYVNGELKEQITASGVDPDSPWKEDRLYWTTIRFAPDDVIKIDARTNDGKYHAWAEVIVPQPIAIEKVDTSIVVKNSTWGSDQILRLKTTFTDNGYKNNYYRIAIEYDLEIEGKTPNSDAYIIYNMTVSDQLIVREDVVLTDGHPSTEDDDNGLLRPVENRYGVFDNSRINGTYTMITSMMLPHNYYAYGYWGEIRDIRRIGISARVRLLSISKMQYFYLKALNIYDSVDYDDFFNLPIKFPTNVEGGTGIVGASTENSVVIKLEDYVPTYTYD